MDLINNGKVIKAISKNGKEYYTLVITVVVGGSVVKLNGLIWKQTAEKLVYDGVLLVDYTKMVK